jgi:hypothetical protein
MGLLHLRSLDMTYLRLLTFDCLLYLSLVWIERAGIIHPRRKIHSLIPDASYNIFSLLDHAEIVVEVFAGLRELLFSLPVCGVSCKSFLYGNVSNRLASVVVVIYSNSQTPPNNNS